jgi:hypothetical protein
MLSFAAAKSIGWGCKEVGEVMMKGFGRRVARLHGLVNCVRGSAPQYRTIVNSVCKRNKSRKGEDAESPIEEALDEWEVTEEDWEMVVTGDEIDVTSVDGYEMIIVEDWEFVDGEEEFGGGRQKNVTEMIDDWVVAGRDGVVGAEVDGLAAVENDLMIMMGDVDDF